jgi:chemotaxis methyl-accepting protein methylase
MLLSEMGRLGDAELLGTDCRVSALAQAIEACYDAPILRDIPSPLRGRYFQPEGTRHQVIAPLRASVHWRRADVTCCAEQGPWDLIFCRNLAMYLQPAAAGAVWRRLELALRPGGFLVVGKAERPAAALHLAQHAPCIYRKFA